MKAMARRSRAISGILNAVVVAACGQVAYCQKSMMTIMQGKSNSGLHLITNGIPPNECGERVNR